MSQNNDKVEEPGDLKDTPQGEVDPHPGDDTSAELVSPTDNVAQPPHSESTSPQPPIENMEVHHHTHTARQKWTHYFWEFFMLFLAVTAGFMAENFREHYIEHNRAKQYASFLYSDLKKDTVNLNDRTKFMAEGCRELDTLTQLLGSFKDNDTTSAKIYALSAYVYSGAFFSATTSTIEQLKSSGSLRYFTSHDLIRNFAAYDTDLHRLKAVEDRNVYLNEEIRKFLTQFLDIKGMSRFTVNTSGDSAGFIFQESAMSKSQKLYKTHPEQLQQYANLCALKQLDWSTRIALQTRVLTSARNLISSLKKEYHLE